jgi:hypothetical protein
MRAASSHATWVLIQSRQNRFCLLSEMLVPLKIKFALEQTELNASPSANVRHGVIVFPAAPTVASAYT